MSKGSSGVVKAINLEKFRRAIQLSTYTYGQLSEVIGVTYATFSRWMNGHYRIPADAYMIICDCIMHDPFDFYERG